MAVYAPQVSSDWPDLLGVREWNLVAQDYGLTRQERNVVRLLCRGYCNQRIANELGISIPTVRSHLRSVYSKLGCMDRMEVLLTLIHRKRRFPAPVTHVPDVYMARVN